jgi:hypothetical protein
VDAEHPAARSTPFRADLRVAVPLDRLRPLFWQRLFASTATTTEPRAAPIRPHVSSVKSRVCSTYSSSPNAFLRDGAFHHQHNEHKRDHDNGQHPEHIEVGQHRCLLLPQVCKRLQRQLLRGNRIAGLLQERSGRLIKEGTCRLVEGIERFAKTQARGAGRCRNGPAAG